jgi:uncharacterized protein YfbU (UPF0304 family)
MKKIIVTIKDDVCMRNGKTAAQQAELLNVLTHYGSVEDYSRHVAVLEAGWQKSLDEMTHQYNAIADQKLTADEYAMVKAYRESKAEVVAEYTVKVDELTETLRTVKEKQEQTKALILAQLGE